MYSGDEEGGEGGGGGAYRRPCPKIIWKVFETDMNMYFIYVCDNVGSAVEGKLKIETEKWIVE